jgi:hypothetical protein
MRNTKLRAGTPSSASIAAADPGAESGNLAAAQK